MPNMISSLYPHLNIRWRTLWRILAVLLVILKISPGALIAAGNRSEVLTELRNSQSTNQSLKDALDVLSRQLEQTRRKLPSDMVDEFDRSVAERLITIRRSVEHNISQDYKNALMAKRVFELTENVMILPYRKLPADSRQRQKASQQYAATLERFERAFKDGTNHLEPQYKAVVTNAILQMFVEIKQDIFRPGYGRPLTPAENTELNQIVDGILQASASLVEQSNQKAAKSTMLREAAKVANDGRAKLLRFFMDREAGMANGGSAVSAIKAWHTENAAIEKAIAQNLKAADEAEIKAVIARADENQERDRKANDPQKIGAAAKAAALQLEDPLSRAKPSQFMRIAVFSLLGVSSIALIVFIIRNKNAKS